MCRTFSCERLSLPPTLITILYIVSHDSSLSDILWGIEYDVGEVIKESGELFGTFAMEDAEDSGDHLELDGFQFTFFRLFRRVEPI